MESSTIGSTFLIMFRETLEAGLIVGIILTMLARLRAMRYARVVWLSIAAAVAASALVGWGLSAVAEATQDRWKELIEGVISLVACGVLTYMVFWMDRQSKLIRPQIEQDVEHAVARQALPAMVALPFLAVFREGAESALFLNAVAMQSGTSVSAAGGLLGSGLAVAITAAIFIGGRRIPLRALFRSTGWLLLIIAAGLLAYGIHELQELGWLPTLIDHVWDINHILNEKVGVGAFLKSLFGYNGNPSLLEVIAYVSYLAIVGWALRSSAKPQPPSSPGPKPDLHMASLSA
ncbi:MAG: high-affinity iron transporter [Candidatus Omnitrophica bacterium CG11_big_fil_rev_8_21_14_0_20_63_9]|nr:MAG: high-affinity iron transporter [Candidatus Omnitrophica bacterium CG11_big_fil_rev_8_21_14_0_20_63_9]